MNSHTCILVGIAVFITIVIIRCAFDNCCPAIVIYKPYKNKLYGIDKEFDDIIPSQYKFTNNYKDILRWCDAYESWKVVSKPEYYAVIESIHAKQLICDEYMIHMAKKENSIICKNYEYE